MKKYLMLIVIIALIIASALAIAAPAFAAAQCTENPQKGWHIVGGGSDNDHWYETEEECLAALPAEETETPTDEPTATDLPATEEPTQFPTDIPIDLPTETPVVEPTDDSTDLPPVVVTEITTQQPAELTEAPESSGNSCYDAWVVIQGVHKETGYRYFENPEHTWCQTWLLNTYGIDYYPYKALNP